MRQRNLVPCPGSAQVTRLGQWHSQLSVAMANPAPAAGDLHTVTLTDVRALDDVNLRKLFSWVDEIPLSRPKKFINRDFSDGVLAAELVKHFLPTYVDMHNYSAASSTRLKEQNWLHLCRRVLRRLALDLSIDVIQAIAECRPWVIETVLGILRHKINVRLSRTHGMWGSGGADWLQRLDGYDGKHSDDDTQRYRSNPMFVTGYSQPNDKYIPSAMDPGHCSHRSNISKTNSIEKKPSEDHFVEMVPKAELSRREKKLVEKENKIQVLLAKVDRLESAVRLKDLLIADLSSRVQQLAKYLGANMYVTQQSHQPHVTWSPMEPPNVPSPRRALRARRS